MASQAFLLHHRSAREFVSDPREAKTFSLDWLAEAVCPAGTERFLIWHGACASIRKPRHKDKSELAATPPPPTTRADGKQRLQIRNKITLPRILPLDHNRSHGTACATIASRPKAIAQRKWLRAITPCIPYEATTAPRRASPPSCRPI